MRSPYGGLSIITPLGAGGKRCKASAVLNSIACNTPARSALRVAKSVIRKLTSPANTATFGECTRSRAACCIARHAACCGLKGSIRSKAKRRCAPGAIPQAICAASMAMVPAPQHGSSSGPSSARPCQPAAASIAAASVSFNGASPLTPPSRTSRQPRLNSASPEVSAYSVAWSGPRNRASGRSGCRVSTLGLSPSCSRTTSHTASLMRSAAKFRLCSGDRTALTSTRSVCAGVIQRSQSTRRARSYSACSSA